MVNRLIIEGNKIDFKDILTQTQMKDGVVAKTYASQVLDIDDKGQMRVSMPIVQGRLVPLSKDRKYEAYFYTSKGMYQSNVVIVDRFRTGNIYTMEIRLLTEPVKYQRRQYYRLEKMIPIHYATISDEEYEFIVKNKQFPESLMEPDVYKSGETVDISGGGMRFIGRAKSEKGGRIVVDFDVTVDGKVIKYKLPSKVIMSFPLPNNSSMYEHRIEFQNIPDKYREILIRYIFEEERKLRKSKR